MQQTCLKRKKEREKIRGEREGRGWLKEKREGGREGNGWRLLDLLTVKDIYKLLMTFSNSVYIILG